jgi:putative membrane protein
MNGFIGRIVLNMVAISLASYLLDGVAVSGIINLFIVAIIFGIINGVIKPVIVFLSLPITLLTFGLFYLVVNGIIVKFTAAITSLSVATFRDAILAGIIIGLSNWILQGIFTSKERRH